MPRKRSPSRAYDAARQIYEDLRDELIEQFIDEPELVREAWYDFTGQTDDPVSEDPDSWIFFDWLMWHSRFESDTGEMMSMLAIMAAEESDAFTPEEKSFIEQTRNSALSFFEVISVEAGRSMTVRDLLVGDEFHVTERSASADARAGDVLFGSIQVLDELSMFLALAPTIIPPAHRLQIVSLKQQLREHFGAITREVLESHSFDLLIAFREILEQLRNPTAVGMTNTDGDLIELRRIQFGLEIDPERAARKLAALTDLESEDDIIARGFGAGEYDLVWTVRGRRRKKAAAERTTILGELRISAGRIVVEVNSERREGQIRELINKKLGRKAKYRATSIEAVKMDGPGGMGASVPPPIDLDANPEIRAILEKQMQAHYEQWPDEPVPALGDRTPREAAADPDFRTVLEGLLIDFERQAKGDAILDPPVDWLRAELGLKKT